MRIILGAIGIFVCGILVGANYTSPPVPRVGDGESNVSYSSSYSSEYIDTTVYAVSPSSVWLSPTPAADWHFDDMMPTCSKDGAKIPCPTDLFEKK